MSKWNTSPEIGRAMDARINNERGYEETLVAGSSEHRLFNLPIAELARAALYEARNGNQGEDYLHRWSKLILMRAKDDPIGAAEEVVRDAYDSQSAKEIYYKNPNQKSADTPLSLKAAQIWGAIVSELAESPLPGSARDALELAKDAQGWLEYGCMVGKNLPELNNQIKAVRLVAEPIVEIEQLVEQQAAIKDRLAELTAQQTARTVAKTENKPAIDNAFWATMPRALTSGVVEPRLQ